MVQSILLHHLCGKVSDFVCTKARQSILQKLQNRKSINFHLLNLKFFVFYSRFRLCKNAKVIENFAQNIEHSTRHSKRFYRVKFFQPSLM